MQTAHTDAAKIMCLVPSKYWWVKVFPLRARFGRQQNGTFIWIGERHENKYRGLVAQGKDATNSLTALSHLVSKGRYSGAARDVPTLPPVVFHGSVQCTVTKGEVCSRSITLMTI